MKFGKKLERLLLAEMGVCLIVLLLSVSDRCSSMAILLSTLFQIFMIIYIIVVPDESVLQIPPLQPLYFLPQISQDYSSKLSLKH